MADDAPWILIVEYLLVHSLYGDVLNHVLAHLVRVDLLTEWSIPSDNLELR